MNEELQQYVRRGQKVWAIASVLVFVVGGILILGAPDIWQSFGDIFYVLLGMSIAAWGTFRGINKKMEGIKLI